ncbi:MAG: nucleotidyltransferase [Paludibacter sp.]|nr:nucleotidyltransferase [Paludibacter sp.]
MTLIDRNIDSVHALCKTYKVARLFVFGSILTNKFKKNSDIDFIVDFQNVELYDYADNYFDFKTSLEQIFKRKIDLLENQAIQNPYLRQSIDSHKLMIYGQ